MIRTLFLTCLIPAAGHSAVSPFSLQAAGVLSLIVGAAMDINLARETAKLETNYTTTDMVVVGYNVSKQSCSVCLPHAGEISCIEVDYKATVQAEFISCRAGQATVEHVYSDSYCGTDAEDANKTAARLSPIGSTTRIWYNTSNPEVWSRAADYELLSYVSNAVYVGGIITIVLGCLVQHVGLDRSPS